MISRKKWGARRARSRVRLDPKKVRGVVIHHTAGSEPDRAQEYNVMRGMQNFHMAPPRNWSDIAYSIVTGPSGRAFKGRGFRVRSAANGSRELNERYISICVMGSNPKSSRKVKRQIRRVRFRVLMLYGWRARRVLPHSEVSPRGTACPGNRLRRWIKDKKWAV